MFSKHSIYTCLIINMRPFWQSIDDLYIVNTRLSDKRKNLHSLNVVATSKIKTTTYSISVLSFYFLGKCISENLLNLADSLGLIANLIAYNYNVPVYKRVFKKYLMGSRTPIVGSVRARLLFLTVYLDLFIIRKSISPTTSTSITRFG